MKDMKGVKDMKSSTKANHVPRSGTIREYQGFNTLSTFAHVSPSSTARVLR